MVLPVLLLLANTISPAAKITDPSLPITTGVGAALLLKLVHFVAFVDPFKATSDPRSTK